MNVHVPRYCAEQARVEACAERLADHLNWKPVPIPELLPPVLRTYRYEPSAHLLLMPSAAASIPRLLGGIRQFRCTGLVLERGSRVDGGPTLYCVLIRCLQGKEHAHTELRIWASEEGELFLVPDPDGTEPDSPCYALSRYRIEPAAAPYADARAQDHGLVRAETVLLTGQPEAVRLRRG
ncbi:hypothetical protein [Pacificimonas flava]|uniref:Uncharacterized protein n=1 Tax=Pacificimonas flava TaxID=1234595 RepID=M2T5Z6_9SPHN|nr:hypothetical protein [Pacificimonas flava]EMD81904.1 hypothetical protein C725_2693 [Pacificimonas flava]MBB5281565.1 hypothetical protein [Pacificimonas flava]